MTCRCLIIAGGTGGHIFPALAVAKVLEQYGCHIDWLGSRYGLEKRYVPEKYALQLLPIKGIRRSGVLGKLLLPWRLLSSIYYAWRMMRRINPDCVLAMGGYAAAPGGLVAYLLGKPLIIHEQNAVPGLTNRYLAKFANVCLQGFDGALPNAMTVGNPVRASLMKLQKVPPSKKMRVLVLGGSQGAHAINQCVRELWCHHLSSADFQLWHQSGAADYADLQACYDKQSFDVRLDAFIDQMDEAYVWADLVICRSGAMTVTEIATVGIASILIPYPFAADDHQLANALFLSNLEAAILLDEADMTVDSLHRLLENFLQNRESLLKMASSAKEMAYDDSAAVVARQCYQFAMKK